MTSGDSTPANAADHIWDAGMFRLFISHVHTHKVAVGAIKRHLGVVGISGFVAHEDITPSWNGRPKSTSLCERPKPSSHS
jgi:hypothetical protein